ncbi:MAG TPA: hypothetical protein VM305_08770 [Candidatus Limnocylindrales bacterium]|nr:hypothetical protein [Candidatus Limnocylindrales bacterium]
MHGQRMRYLTVVFGLALVVLIGGILAVLATRPTGNLAGPRAVNGPWAPSVLPSVGTDAQQRPGPGLPSGTATGEAAEQTMPSATLQAPAEPVDAVASSTPAPQPALETPPLPDASPAPAVPGQTASVPVREVTFNGLGLDSGGVDVAEPTTPRFFTFNAEGPGVIRVQLASATGLVHVCIWPGVPGHMTDEACRSLRSGAFERSIDAGGANDWTVSLIGAQASGSPSTTLRLTFPTNDNRLRLDGFRFQGHGMENYNGFSAEVRTSSPGEMSVSATLDDGEGGMHPYRLVIQATGGGPSQPFIAESEGSSLHEVTELQAERGYLVTLANRAEVTEEAIMLTAQLEWP